MTDSHQVSVGPVTGYEELESKGKTDQSKTGLKDAGEKVKDQVPRSKTHYEPLSHIRRSESAIPSGTWSPIQREAGFKYE